MRKRIFIAVSAVALAVVASPLAYAGYYAGV
jgi:hypothetical protein